MILQGTAAADLLLWFPFLCGMKLVAGANIPRCEQGRKIFLYLILFGCTKVRKGTGWSQKKVDYFRTIRRYIMTRKANTIIPTRPISVPNFGMGSEGRFDAQKIWFILGRSPKTG